MTDGSTWLYCVGGGASSLMLAAALSKYPVLPGPLRIAERKANLGQAQALVSGWTDRIPWIISSKHAGRVGSFPDRIRKARYISANGRAMPSLKARIFLTGQHCVSSLTRR